MEEITRSNQIRSINENIIITPQQIPRIINKSLNWKAAGIDRIHNFWYKKLKCTHVHIAHHFNDFMQNPNNVPKFFAMEKTYLLPKDSNDTENPSKYLPITSLPTIYKFLTSCITEMIYGHCIENNIIAVEQRGCIKNSQGCKEQLIIDTVVFEQAKYKKDVYTLHT